jgi:cell division initiation protein
MIDLTPLDIRKKKGDFGRALRGYELQEVDTFLEMAAERLEEVVRENLTLRERVERLSEQVHGQEGREKAVQEALVSAQALREEIHSQARREADLIRREAEADAQALREAAERELGERSRELQELNRRRTRFLRGLRTFLEREIDAVTAEEDSPPQSDFEELLPRADSDRRPSAFESAPGEDGGGTSSGAGTSSDEVEAERASLRGEMEPEDDESPEEDESKEDRRPPPGTAYRPMSDSERRIQKGEIEAGDEVW